MASEKTDKRGGWRPGAGRKRKKIDLEQVQKLSVLNISEAELAYQLGMDPKTFQLRKDEDQKLAAAINFTIERGRASGRVSLRRAMHIAATQKMNPTMMIWLSKQLLGYSDKVEVAETKPKEVKYGWVPVKEKVVSSEAKGPKLPTEDEENDIPKGKLQ